MNNTMIFIDEFAYRSPFANCHAMLKFIFTAVVLILCLLFQDIAVSIYIFVTMFLCNVFKNHVKWNDYVKLLTIPFLFIFFDCIAIALEINYNNIFFISVTKQSFLKSIFVMMRAFASVSILYFFALSTPLCDMIWILQKLHIPKIVIELMYMIYRYIFILIDVQYQLKNASLSRLGYIDFKTSCRTFVNCIANLLILSIRKAEKYYQAMVSRCYDGELAFLKKESIWNIYDVIKAVCYIFTVIAVKYILYNI